MNRLRDDVGDDPVAARGIELLRGRAATPDDNEMKRRVWGALQQTRLRAAAPTPLYRLRALVAAVIVLVLAGTAGAMIRQRWIASERALAPALAPLERATTASRAGTGKVVPRAAGTDTSGHSAANTHTNANANADLNGPQTSPSPATPLPTKQRAGALATAREHGGERAQERARSGVRGAEGSRGEMVKAVSVAAVARERTEVLDAMVALRRDHDAVRAGALLDDYLTAHPRGVLREEALVLAVEAADARGDAGTARRLARAYQAAFPGGRFTPFARDRADAERP
jgi:hypothetical protein